MPLPSASFHVFRAQVTALASGGPVEVKCRNELNTRREELMKTSRAASDKMRSQVSTQEKLLPPGVLQEESTLGTQDAAATEAELSALSKAELSASHDPERMLISIAGQSHCFGYRPPVSPNPLGQIVGKSACNVVLK